MTDEPRDSEDAELPLGPVQGKSADELRVELELSQRTLQTTKPLPASDAISSRFTLREMFALMFFAGASFGVLRLVPLEVSAGLMGLASVLGLALISIYKPSYLLFYLAWWTVLAMYIVTSIIAVVTR